ncbi:hypothetical protein BBL97_04480 [Vibrio parahaemolyticus]|uniref:hypothetical protein n=1 Tax=Vibrio parahaemolyticus TaxID=670 RepID=UPI00084B60C6|nr:hypothetical protein [Vibrio parahaemolyticus]ODW92426.1 hypothetical protein BBL95_13065 [Vibrio parahaemolyticus]ODX07157.1 hypothetical protein BBL96_10550 [Vibrio parahaemolyticus]ODX10746.1 hypothetical protein BBL97_04480 [Vibrio parahaemolyticus]ODX14024.1 hypothetical protein BBL98_00560 [Vibrio parahaemolyticus]ODX18074.1 hypothetical protein BBL99_11845 [Vibrio parahaemolyticus]
MSNLSIEQKLRLSELRLLKESESFVLVKFYDEKEQQEKGVSDSYYISEETDMEDDILKAKYFDLEEQAYAFKSSENIKAIPVKVLADFEIHKTKN